MSDYEFQVTVVIEPDGNGFYAHCPGLPGVFACGDTPEEALDSARDGALSILRTKLRLGDSIEENHDLIRLKAPTKQLTPVLRRLEEMVTIPVEMPT